MRLEQLRVVPAEHRPWLLRAIVYRESQRVCGHINFHSFPGSEDLREIAADGVELGYYVGEKHRGQGYTKEAAFAMMRWALEHHQQHCFILLIRPDNVASLIMAGSLGRWEVGSHIDEEDGLELYFQRRINSWPEEWS